MQTTFQRNDLAFSYIVKADLPDIVRMLAKESVCRLLSFGPNTEQDTRNYFEPLVESIGKSLEMNELPKEHVFTIRKENGEFLGQCGLLPIAFSPGNFLIGYTLDDTGWRQGYGEKSCRFLVEYAFNILRASRISGDCFSGNIGSRRVMEKCGFIAEGCQKRYWTKNGEVYDNLLFGLLNRENNEPDS